MEGCHLICFSKMVLKLCVTVKRIPVQGILSICLVSNSALAGRLVRLVICSLKNRMCRKIWKVWTTCVIYQFHFLRMGKYVITIDTISSLSLTIFIMRSRSKDKRLQAQSATSQQKSRILACFFKETLFELLYQQRKLCQRITSYQILQDSQYSPPSRQQFSL